MGCGASSSNPGKESGAIVPNGVSEKKKLETGDDTLKFHGLLRWNKDAEGIAQYMKLPNCCDVVDPKNGNSALHIAAQNGHIDLVKQLIDLKHDVNKQNAKGNTALHMSTGYDYYAVSKMLIENGADCKIKNKLGNTADTGLEGDRTLAACAIVSAETVEDFLAALDMMKTTYPRGMRKDFYIKCGLRMKKQEPEMWLLKDAQKKFTEILNEFDKAPQE